MQLNDRYACATELRRTLKFQSNMESMEEELLAVFVDTCEEGEDADTNNDAKPRYELRVGRWVVLDSDLDLFSIIKDAVLALAPARFMFSSLTEAGLASLVFSLLQIALNAHRNGALLTREQVQLLLVLKAQNRAIEPSELNELLQSSTGSIWTVERVMEELGTLTAFPTRGGSAALVLVNGNGRWIANGF